MNGFDLILKNNFTSSQVRQCIAMAFDVSEESVAVLDGYPEQSLPAGTKFLVMRTQAGGDFQLHLSIDLLTPDAVLDPLLITKKLSVLFESECLVPEQGANPYLMYQVSPDSSIRKILLRANDLDNGDYRVMN